MAEGQIRFDGRAVLITGAGRGLGRTQALLLASRGAKIVVADNGTAMDGEDPSRGPAEAVVAEIKSAGGEAVACTVDIASEEGSRQAVEASMDAFGRIDGIAHFASTCPDPSLANELSTRDLDLVMKINPYAALWLAKAAWPHMDRQNYGRIVYLTSGGAYGALGATTYGTAKAAIIGVMRCLALEGVSKNILVNAASPSAKSRMTERFPPSAYSDWFHETMLPEKVAVGVGWLLSEECSLHGEILAMGGGRIAHVTFAETDGIFGTTSSMEDVREMIPEVMADTRWIYPKELTERAARVTSLFGFGAEPLDSSGAYTIQPMEKN